MAVLSRERRRQILESLASAKCEGCGGPKSPRKSHCRFCYFALPARMRQALYQRFGEGYEDAFEESLKYLAGRRAA